MVALLPGPHKPVLAKPSIGAVGQSTSRLARFISRAQPGLCSGLGGDRGGEDLHGQPLELEASVEAIGERRPIARGIFREVKGMVTRGRHRHPQIMP